jgi:hypothetical protein
MTITIVIMQRHISFINMKKMIIALTHLSISFGMRKYNSCLQFNTLKKVILQNSIPFHAHYLKYVHTEIDILAYTEITKERYHFGDGPRNTVFNKTHI